jgi:uncharacterized protein
MRSLYWISLLIVASTAHAASLNCIKAETPQEHAICNSPVTSVADDNMAGAYKIALAEAPPETVASIERDQRA